MKKLFTFLSIFLFSQLIQAQCTDLFFSEYIEGWSNNKALEIYNPTNESVDLSAYSISRYSNGGTSPSTTQLTGTIEPYSTFVVGLDKRDPDGEGYEAPMWDGYYTYTDSITGQEVTIYDADSDLQSKVDLFVNPIYYFGTNADSAAAFPTSLYFNGNDAITLEILGGGIVLDLIGKVGEDPGASWTDNDGNYWTKDHTLVRKESIVNGVTANPIIFDPTLEWDSLPANTFINLGAHDCACNPNNELIENSNGFTVLQKSGVIKIINDCF